MKKELLTDHWITKEFGLEVFTHPEEIANFVYVKTSNGVTHRFHKSMLEDKEYAIPKIKELNDRTYQRLMFQYDMLKNAIYDLTQMYWINNGIIPEEDIRHVQELIKQ